MTSKCDWNLHNLQRGGPEIEGGRVWDWRTALGSLGGPKISASRKEARWRRI